MGSIREVLKNCSVFKDLDDARLDKIVAICHKEESEAGSYVFKEGEMAKNLYVVQSGRISLEKEIVISARSHRTATTTVLVPGEICGWSASLEGRPFLQSALCVEPTSVVGIDSQSLRNICIEDPELGYHLMTKLVLVVSTRYTRLAETLARVLAITAHDLKAPVAAVQSYLQVILGGFTGEVDEKQKTILSRCSDRCGGLLNLVGNILDLSQIESAEAIEKRPISLLEVAKTCIMDAERLATQKGLNFRVELPVKLSTINGSASRLQQVINNLLQNAIKFTMVPGGILFRLSESDDEVKVEVLDTGVGIKPDELPKIFDDYFHGTTIATEGAGLGLYICKKIIRAHGGKIWAESPCSETGHGTKLTFTMEKLKSEEK